MAVGILSLCVINVNVIVPQVLPHVALAFGGSLPTVVDHRQKRAQIEFNPSDSL